jgi:hypothetical protein
LWKKPFSSEIAAVQRRLDEAHHQETADGGNADEDRQQAPAGAPDELVVDVLIGDDADVENEHAERDDARKDAFLHRRCHQARVGSVVFGSDIGHGFKPSRLPDDRECRSA